MLQVKHIKEFSFGINQREGKFFNNGFPLSSDEQKSLIKNNIVIGYQGKHFTLRSWASQQSKGLTVHNLPGETIEHKRQLLWQSVKQDKVDRWLIDLANQVKQHEVTLYYLSSQHDKPVAELIQRFIAWYNK